MLSNVYSLLTGGSDCFIDEHCTVASHPPISSQNDCCMHGVAPFGLSFAIPGVEGCNACPVGKYLDNIQILYYII